MKDIVIDIFTMIGRVIAGVLFICTIAILILGFQDINSIFLQNY